MSSENLRILEQGEVETRLEKAQFYREVLSSLKPDPGASKVQADVMAELQSFVVDRMKVLMGVTPTPKAQDPEALSKDDISVLKQVIQKLQGIGNEETVEEETQDPEPQVVAKPKPQVQAKLQPKPQVKRDPNSLPMGLVATGNTLEMPFEVKSPTGMVQTKVRTYKEVTAPDGSVGWLGVDGQMYIIKDDPQTGLTFMHNVTRQSKSKNHARFPPTYGTKSVLLAAEQADKISRGKSQNKLIMDAADRYSEVDAFGLNQG